MKKIICIITILMFTSIFYSFADDVEVKLPGFDVILNGDYIDNSVEAYPFITYNGITYFPMTWDLSSALGLEVNWSKADGLEINKKSHAQLFEAKGGSVNRMKSSYTASIVTFPVKVNGNEVEHTDSKYPLLNFRNVTYFPMTYQFMVKEFDCGYTWNKNEGLSVDVDSELEFKLPKAFEVKTSVTKEYLDNNYSYSNEYVKLQKKVIEGDNFLNFSLLKNQNETFDDYLIDVTYEYYDDKDQLIHRRPIYYGKHYSSSYYNYDSVSNLMASEFEEIRVTLIFRSKTAARAIVRQSGIKVEYLSSNELTKEKIVQDGGVYLHSMRDGVRNSFEIIDEPNYKYAAIKSNNGVIKADDKLYNTYLLLDNGKIVIGYSDYESGYKKIKNYDKLVINVNNEYRELELYSDNYLIESIESGIVKIYNDEKKLIKVYCITDISN